MKNIVFCASLTVFLLTAGCAATSLSPQAGRVMVYRGNLLPEKCRFVGLVTGSQGNFFSGSVTSNRNLEEGAMNDLRNRAASLGGNTVLMTAGDLYMNAASGSGRGTAQQTDATYSGMAFDCPGNRQ